MSYELPLGEMTLYDKLLFDIAEAGATALAIQKSGNHRMQLVVNKLADAYTLAERMRNEKEQ